MKLQVLAILFVFNFCSLMAETNLLRHDATLEQNDKQVIIVFYVQSENAFSKISCNGEVARYFSDEMGRFISRDPLGYVDGMSLCNAYFAEVFGLDPMGTHLGGLEGSGAEGPKNPKKSVHVGSNDTSPVAPVVIKDIASILKEMECEKDECNCFLEIESHGNKTYMDIQGDSKEPAVSDPKKHGDKVNQINKESATYFGQRLAKEGNFCKLCLIYLSSCWSGVDRTKNSMGAKIAIETGCTVIANNASCSGSAHKKTTKLYPDKKKHETSDNTITVYNKSGTGFSQPISFLYFLKNKYCSNNK